MKNKALNIAGMRTGGNADILLIAGPCVIESRKSALLHARKLRDIAKKAKIPFIFKASYDKANRSSIKSFRGPGIEEGLEILRAVKDEIGVPVLSDVHAVHQIKPAEKVKTQPTRASH